MENKKKHYLEDFRVWLVVDKSTNETMYVEQSKFDESKHKLHESMLTHPRRDIDGSKK